MTHPGARPHVLIVDDDLPSSSELGELLETFNLGVSLAVTVEEARALAAAAMPDLAIIDLELGSASGVELALDWHSRADTPVVVLISGRPLSPQEVRRFAGYVPVQLSKPVDVDQLLKVARKRLE